VVGIIIIVALLNPFSLLFEALLLGGVLQLTVPACRERIVATGDFQGFRIGMSEADAVAVLARQTSEPDAMVGTDFVRSFDELRAASKPDQAWSINRGRTCVVMDSHWLTLTFIGGKLTQVRDSPSMTMP
jgi:hypothetical protein